jgi:hypothetical protein
VVSGLTDRNLIARVNVEGEKALRAVLGERFDANADYRFVKRHKRANGWVPTGIETAELELVTRPKEIPCLTAKTDSPGTAKSRRSSTSSTAAESPDASTPTSTSRTWRKRKA